MFFDAIFAAVLLFKRGFTEAARAASVIAMKEGGDCGAIRA